MRTKTHEDAGKAARFAEVFKLGALDKLIGLEEALAVETYDEDVGSSDLLGAAKPIPYADLIKSTEKQTARHDIFKQDKKTGDVLLEWQYFWEEPDVACVPRDPKEHPLNKKCKMEVTIIEAKFLKDADTFGKMDPYIRFKYGRGEKQTRVADDAGKHAVFNEKFTLSNISQQVDAGASLELVAMEKDVGSSDLLGTC